MRPWAPGFLTAPVNKAQGTCAGDSGGAALLRLQDPQGRGLRQIVLGVQAEASVPCEGNKQIFIFPDYFQARPQPEPEPEPEPEPKPEEPGPYPYP